MSTNPFLPYVDGNNSVAIDARAFSHPQPGGFKTYSKNLIKRLPAMDNYLNFVMLLDRPVDKTPDSLLSNVSVKIIPNSLPLCGVPFRENVALPFDLALNPVDMIHFPSASAALWSPRPFVITIHDAMELMAMPTRYGSSSVKRSLMHLYYRYNQIVAARKAAAIITVSRCSKRDIAHCLNVSEDRIVVIYEAPDDGFSKIRDESRLQGIRRKYNLEEAYILGIGSADPRKNMASLIRAYSQLPSETKAYYQLVIVLTHQRFQESLLSLTRALGVAQRVKFLTAVPNADLALLYNSASLFVFPSLYEGFGLPPLEAMACGVPVVAANNSSIPEILGDAAVLVDDVNPAGGLEELTQKILHVLEDPAMRSSLAQRGMARARSFSWDRCAGETVDVYNMVLETIRSRQLSHVWVRA